MQASSYGIWATGDLTFNGATVNGYGGLTHVMMAFSAGIFAEGNFEIKSGDVYGQGGGTTLSEASGWLYYISVGAGCGQLDSGDAAVKSTFKMSGGSFTGRAQPCLEGYYVAAGVAGSLGQFDVDTDLFDMEKCQIRSDASWGTCAYWLPDEPVEESDPATITLKNVLVLLAGVENIAPTGET